MANIAYYCLHNFNLLPQDFLKLTIEERAFIVASIDIKLKERKKIFDSLET